MNRCLEKGSETKSGGAPFGPFGPFGDRFQARFPGLREMLVDGFSSTYDVHMSEQMLIERRPINSDWSRR